MEASPPIGTMSTDTLGLVFQWLSKIDPQSLVHDIPRVCRRWREAVRLQDCGVLLKFVMTLPRLAISDFTMETLAIARAMASIRAFATQYFKPTVKLSVIGALEEPTLIAVLAESSGWVSQLSVEGVGAYAESIVGLYACANLVMEHCPKLTHLSFLSLKNNGKDYVLEASNNLWFNTCNRLLGRLVAAYPQLEEIVIDGLSPTADGWCELAKCKRLQKVDVGVYYDALDDDTLGHMLDSCPLLSMNAIQTSGYGTKHEGDVALLAASKKWGTVTNSWTVGLNSKHTVAGIEAVLETRPAAVTHLDLTVPLPMAGAGVLPTIAAGLPCLTHLTLRSGHRTHIDYTAPCLVEFFNQASTSLTHLSMIGVMLTHELAEAIATACGPRLHKLSLVNLSKRVAASDGAKLFARCPNLKVLCLNQPYYNNPKSYDALASLELETLEMANSMDVADSDMLWMQRLKHLKHLTVSMYKTSSGEPMTWSVLPLLSPGLTSLELDTGLSATLFVAILNALASLTSATVRLVNGVGEMSLKSVVSPLRRLDLTGSRLRMADVAKLVRHVPTLTWLGLEGCHDVDARLINALKHKVVAKERLLHVKHSDYNQHYVYQPDSEADGRDVYIYQTEFNHSIDPQCPCE